MAESPYAPPAAGSYAQAPSTPGLWRVFGTLVALFNLLLYLGVSMMQSRPISESVGYAVGGALVWPAIIVLLFRIGKRFRNPRSAWKIFFWTSAVILFTGLANFAARAVDAVRNVDVTSESFLEASARVASVGLPEMLDEETELFEISAGPAMLIYHHRLVNYLAEELDAEAFEQSMRPGIVEQACGLPETRDDLLAKGVTLRYLYVGKDDVEVCRLDIVAAECGLP